MAIRLEDEYTEAVAASASYPGGSFKNTSTPGGTDGTPLELAWADDFLGARDAVLSAAGQGYSGAPDTASTSDFLTALYTLFVKNSDAVSAATANKIIKRDANGRAKVVGAVANDDIAILSDVTTVVNNASLGVGQTWQSVTRTAGVDYQNTTGKPIMVSARVGSSATGATAYVGVTTGSYVSIGRIADTNTPTENDTITFIVPPNHYYRITGVPVNWVELR